MCSIQNTMNCPCLLLFFTIPPVANSREVDFSMASRWSRANFPALLLQAHQIRNQRRLWRNINIGRQLRNFGRGSTGMLTSWLVQCIFQTMKRSWIYPRLIKNHCSHWNHLWCSWNLTTASSEIYIFGSYNYPYCTSVEQCYVFPLMHEKTFKPIMCGCVWKNSKYKHTSTFFYYPVYCNYSKWLRTGGTKGFRLLLSLCTITFAFTFTFFTSL